MKFKKKKRKRAKSAYEVQKKNTDNWCSRYIRIRDSIGVGGKGEWGKCYTCGKVVLVPQAQSGHFKSRGFGGSSGTYFDERGIHLQCRPCNAFEQGRPEEYEEHLIKDYGEQVVAELKLKHKVGSYTLMDLAGLEIYFKNRVLAWCESYGIRKWWE
jgi:hypothetical protein